MSDPVIIPLLIASTVISAGASIQQGRAAKQAEAFRRQELEQEQTRTTIKTLDDSLERARENERLIAAGEAQGAQGGFDPFSMGSSFLAIREENERVGRDDIEMIRLAGANAFGKLEAQKIQSRLVGKNAQTQGFLTAASTLAQGGVKVAQV